MQCNEVIERLERLAPAGLAESWDNVGLLAGRENKEITSVMFALDATDEVIGQAAEQGVSMLITHHPLIFKPVKRIQLSDFTGRRIIRLLQNDICYYAMHTNFDVAVMADAAAERLELAACRVLDVTCMAGEQEEGIGRFGLLPEPVALQQCALNIKEKFNIQNVKVFGSPDTVLQRAAVCPGSGKSVIGKAAALEADVLITGDIDHHCGLDALAQGLCVIDAGHFGLEKLFSPYMKSWMERELPELAVLQAAEEAPFWVV